MYRRYLTRIVKVIVIDVDLEVEETISTNKCLSSSAHSVISNASNSTAFFDDISIIFENSICKTIQLIINTYMSNIEMYEGNKNFFLCLKNLRLKPILVKLICYVRWTPRFFSFLETISWKKEIKDRLAFGMQSDSS